MLLCGIWISLVCAIFAQETNVLQTYNISDSPFGLNRYVVDDEPPQTNFWLISRNDPIPAGLHEQVLSGPDQTGGVASVGYGMRLRGASNEENASGNTLQTRLIPESRFPIYYSQVQTSENRRQGLDTNLNVPQGSVLVELPVEITEGLWVRPQPDVRNPPLRSGRNVAESSLNVKLDEVVSPQTEEIPVFPSPLLEAVSRFTNGLPQGSSPVVPQYIGLPHQFAYSDLPSSSAQSQAIRSEVNDENVWLLSRDQNGISSENNFTTSLPGSSDNGTSEQRGVHEYGILTSEDIELLERLGILSAVVIEPIHLANLTSNFTLLENSLREQESEPVFIDYGGQTHLKNLDRDDVSATLSDVVLLDIPHFATPEYGTNLPENDREKKNSKNFTLEPIAEPATDRKNGSWNNTNLTDRQVLELLQILTRNTGDVYNLSVLSQVNQSSVDPAVSSSASNTSIRASNLSNYSDSTSGKPASESATVVSKAISSTNSNSRFLDLGNFRALPTLSREQAQSRILQKLAENGSKINLRANAVPESKLKVIKAEEMNPKSYLFGFKQVDGNGTLQHRNEKADASGIVKGTYGYKDAFGVYRNVSYIADNSGFHAVVKTNEPGTVSHNTADAVFMAETPPLAALAKMLAYKRFKNLRNTTNSPSKFT